MLNPNIQVDTFDFLLNPLFLMDIVQKNQKPVFQNQRVPPVSVYYLKWRAKFQISRLLIRNSDWFNFIHFSGYKYKIRLVRLRKREEQALISISTILKFPALINYFLNEITGKKDNKIMRIYLITRRCFTLQRGQTRSSKYHEAE